MISGFVASILSLEPVGHKIIHLNTLRGENIIKYNHLTTPSGKKKVCFLQGSSYLILKLTGSENCHSYTDNDIILRLFRINKKQNITS